MSAHARKRALERYGVAVTAADLEEMVIAIEGGIATHLMEAAGGLHVYQLRCQGRRMCVLYDPSSQAIPTILTRDQVEGMKRKRRAWQRAQGAAA